TKEASIKEEKMELLTNTTSNWQSSVNQTCNISIDDFRNKAYSTVYSLVTVFGFVGNGFALFVLIRTFRQKTAFHIYMLNLAISDLLCVCTLPLRVVYYVHKGQWLFGDALCRISTYAFYVNLYCSILFMTAMSLSRFIAIVFPVKNLNLVNVKKAKIVCLGIWIFVTLTTSPFLMTGTSVKNNKTKCFEPPDTIKPQLLALNYISLVVGCIIPFCVILLCYTLIIRALLNNQMKNKSSSHKKAIRLIIIVMTAFFVCFLPYHIQRTIHIHFLMQKNSCEDRLNMQKSVVITLCLAASNTCIDPLLYFFSGENFRRRLSTIRKGSLSVQPKIKNKKSTVPDDKSDDDNLSEFKQMKTDTET
uniref:Cysteinyl leukotriene receptor 1 n=1 Tax=Latimeria chalumnae TaxID=7897 RepID=H3A1G9_LATCH